MQIRKLLVRCQNHLHQLMVGTRWLFSYLYFPALLALQYHNANVIVFMLLLFGSGIFMLVLANRLYAFIVDRLKMETQIFLLPGVARTNQVYGRREAVGRSIIALAVSIILTVSLIFAVRILWR